MLISLFHFSNVSDVGMYVINYSVLEELKIYVNKTLVLAKWDYYKQKHITYYESNY